MPDTSAVSAPSAVSPARPAPTPTPAPGRRPHRRRRLRQALAWTAGGAAVIAAAIWVAPQVSPWPSALAIRAEFDEGGRAANAALAPWVPDDVAAIRDVAYPSDAGDALLDVYHPAALAPDQALPTVVWTHGGGWVSGSKDQVANYAQILAGHGYTVVAIDYTLAPEARYPTPVIQLDAALGFLTANAADLHVDPTQIFLAGDSAGSQISAQVATLITSPAYADLMGITPSIGPDALAGVVLHCGPYDMAGVGGDQNRNVLWAYSGKKDPSDDPAFAAASVVHHVTGDFPAAYLTGGNADPLTVMGKAFHARLLELGVESTGVFPDEPGVTLWHEYQFDLSIPAAQSALAGTHAFLESHTS